MAAFCEPLVHRVRLIATTTTFRLLGSVILLTFLPAFRLKEYPYNRKVRLSLSPVLVSR
jgi:hypothetical protein